MELTSLRYVVAVADERSFTRAAARCFVSQSALSHQVAALEREIGAVLFARTSRRVEVTAAGDAFVAAARRCLDEADAAVAAAAAAEGRITGSLGIGTIPTLSAVDLAALLTTFTAACPEVSVQVLQMPSSEAMERLAAGTLQLAFLGLPDDARPLAGLAALTLGHAAHSLYVGRDHRLAKRSPAEPVDLSEVAAEHWVDFPASSPGRRQTDLTFEAAGLQRNVGIEAESPDLLLDFVSRGGAVTALPAGLRHGPHGGAGAVELELADGPRRTQYLAWSDFNARPATRAFVELVRSQV